MLLLIYPDCKLKNYQCTASELSAIQPNVYMGMIHSYVEKYGIDSITINADADRLTNDEIVHQIEKIQPTLIGIVAMGHNLSSSTMTMVGVIDLARKLRGSYLGITTFVVGGHPSALPERTLKETGVNHVIVGEGYDEIVSLYNGDLHEPIVRSSKLIDLNQIPTIDWISIDPTKYRAHNWHCLDDFDNRSPYATIWTSMGCPYPCGFCAANNMFGGPSYRMRDMKKVIQEIDFLVVNYGVKSIKILDELFITKHKRIDEFCDLLEERQYDLTMWCFSRVDTVEERILKRLKKVGMNWIAYGFESVDQEALDSLQKKNQVEQYKKTIQMTKDAGINICADVMVGLPNDNCNSISKLYDFCVDSEFEWVNVYPAFAYPGTPFYQEAITAGLMEEPKSWDQYSPYSEECRPLKTRYLSSESVVKLRDDFFRRYHSRPEYLQMIRDKFGVKAREHVEEMCKINLTRREHETV